MAFTGVALFLLLRNAEAVNANPQPEHAAEWTEKVNLHRDCRRRDATSLSIGGGRRTPSTGRHVLACILSMVAEMRPPHWC